MTVPELIQRLKEFPMDARVKLTSTDYFVDEVGNITGSESWIDYTDADEVVPIAVTEIVIKSKEYSAEYTIGIEPHHREGDVK